MYCAARIVHTVAWLSVPNETGNGCGSVAGALLLVLWFSSALWIAWNFMPSHSAALT